MICRMGIAMGAIAVAVGVIRADDKHVLISFERRQLSKEFWAEGATFGDFNRDGKMDVVVGPHWYEGPEFSQRHEFYPNEPYEKDGNYYGSCDSKLGDAKNPKGPFPITTYSDNFFGFAGDFNSDGWTDILILGFPGRQTCWYENPQAKGGHWPRHVAFDVTDNESPGFHDLLGNGKPVLVCSSRGQYGYAKPNPGNPNAMWRWNPITPVGNYQRFTHGMGVGDVNADGRPDLLEKDGWWEQPAAGMDTRFWYKHPYPFSAAGGSQMCVADLNGDDRPDVVASLAAHQYGIAWFENVAGPDGQITFKKHLIVGDKQEDNKYGVVFSQPHALALVDMDGDGLPDIVTGKRKWAHGIKGDPRPADDAVTYWFKTVRSGSDVDFVPHLIDNNAGVGTQVVVGDLNRDGRPDVVVGNKLGAFVFLQKAREVSAAEWKLAQPAPLEKKKLTAPKGPSTAARAVGGVAPKDASGKSLNLDFEKGTLEDWTAVGDAFQGQPIEGDVVFPRRGDMHSRHAGQFWIGGYERRGDAPQGTLTSVPFKITHPFASFLVAGGAAPTTAVEIVLHEAGRRGDYVQFRVSGDNSEELKRVVVDLSAHIGKQMFVRLVDRAAGSWDHLNFDDFRFHADPPTADRSAAPPPPDAFANNGLAPEAAAKAITVPEGFKVTLFAGEPDVRQPIAFTIDDRGRLWVVEGYSYPRRQPEGQGKDRILIFDDVDGDGKFDRRTVFMEGLNLVSGIELGFGGVWIGAAPYLMFVPVDQKTDRPAGPAKILLDGWGWQDTHETLNAFQWGPDGWLYGCHGVFTHSRVGKPGATDAERVPLNAGVWRYHPTRHKFEVFAHGTSNPWGVDWDDRGQCFVTACVIPHLFHLVQGGRFLRQAGQHFNPYTYDDIKEICDHVHYVGANPHGGNGRSDDAGGGHAHCGAMIYLGGTWPATYRNQIFMGNVHGRRINVNKLDRHGSGYVGRRAPDFLKANDSYAQFINLRYGPDGNVYIIDWYDANRCHRNEVEAHDRGNGRIYKVSYANTSKPSTVDLARLSDEALAGKCLSPNEFHFRHARRLLQERSSGIAPHISGSSGDIGKGATSAEKAGTAPSSGAVAAAQNILMDAADVAERLRALWALDAAGGLTARWIDYGLRDSEPYLRAWTIQLALDGRERSKQLEDQIADMAAREESPVVRLYLAAAAERLPVNKRWKLVAGLLARSEDQSDHNLPLMTWYAAEPLADADPIRALKLAVDGKLDIVVRFMARRVGSAGTLAAVDAVVQSIAATDDSAKQRSLLLGLREALRGRRRFSLPPAWPAALAKLRSADDEPARAIAMELAVAFGDPTALANLRAIVADSKQNSQRREAALATLVGVGDAQLSPMLPKLAADRALAGAALRAMANYDDPAHAPAILAAYASYSPAEKRDALNTLAARKTSAHRLLEAVAAKSIPATDVTADIVRQLRFLGDKSLDRRLNEVWGTVRDSPADKAKLIADYKRMLERKHKLPADPALGRAIFAKTCQQCHKLFGVGDAVGPELTGSNRVNLDYILSNVLDPSAMMAKEYQPTIFVKSDGRVVTGLIREQSAAAIAVRTANETVVLPRNEIESMRLSDKSMMPDDQLKPMSEFEVRSLIAYLASPEQTPIRATADNVKLFFNGKDLSNWNGEMKYWSVENGEIVGKSSGMKHNQFLASDLLVGDFSLKLDVKLTPNEGNSGIQFRSKRIEGTEMLGYQADIGKGWWGKLYEESGRGMLVNESGERWLKPNDWNRYEIRAVGNRVQISLNGHRTVDFTDAKGARSGQIAVQIHAGPPVEVRFRNIQLELLHDR